MLRSPFAILREGFSPDSEYPMLNCQIMHHRLFLLALLLVLAVPAYGQPIRVDGVLVDDPFVSYNRFNQPADTDSSWHFIPGSVLVPGPYAGKYEARIGGWRESENDKLRLDIGGSVDIVRYGERGKTGDVFSAGADFFTWTRLRAAGGFKFPVEAVDYYFGINGAWRSESYTGIPFNLRVRLAHISAHLVDGDPSFTSPQQQYITYSREFLDVMMNIHGIEMISPVGDANIALRPYAGAQWLFHTIPDTLGVVTPYAGLDLSWQPGPALPLTFRFGYEARLNTELEPIGEHQARLGVKIGDVDSRGVILEGSYYSGRSHYGQHFSRREEFFSLGFAVEF